MKIQEFTRAELKELLQKENLLAFNRDITSAHVNKMAMSIEECGLLRAPIIGMLNYLNPPQFAIIDGQHLTSAIVAIEGKHKYKYDNVDCIITEFETKKDVINTVATLNNTQNSWNDSNYLTAWYLFGADNVEYYKNYQFIHNLHKNDNLPCSFVITLYCLSKEKFKTGELTFREKEFCDHVYRLALMLKNKYDKQSPCLYGLENWAKRRYFLDKKTINFQKLESRLRAGLRTKEHGAMSTGRDDFGDWIEQVYTRL